MGNLSQYLIIILLVCVQFVYAQNNTVPCDNANTEVCTLLSQNNARICQKCLNGGESFFSPNLLLDEIQPLLQNITKPANCAECEGEKVWIVPARFLFGTEEFAQQINEDKVANAIMRAFPESIGMLPPVSFYADGDPTYAKLLEKYTTNLLNKFVNDAFAKIVALPNQEKVVILFVTETYYASSSKEGNTITGHLSDYKKLYLVGMGINPQTTQKHYQRYFDIVRAQQEFTEAETIGERDVWLSRYAKILSKVASRDQNYIENLAGLSKRETEYAQALQQNGGNQEAVTDYDEFEKGGFLYNPNRKYNPHTTTGKSCVPNFFENTTKDCINIGEYEWATQFFEGLGGNPTERQTTLNTMIKGCLENVAILEVALSCQKNTNHKGHLLTYGMDC